MYLNTLPAGGWGGGVDSAHLDFSIGQKTRQILTKTVSNLPSINLTSSSERSQKSALDAFEKIRLVTSCFSILGKTTANDQRLLECTALKQNTNEKHQKM